MRDELLTPLATKGEFTLYERKHRSTVEWRDLRLTRRTSDRPTKNWRLGWNGERLARCRESEDLAKNFPIVHRWVIGNLAGKSWDAVPCLGEPLHPILWHGRQWAVTTFGIEARDGTYAISKDRLDDPYWPTHMAEKDGATSMISPRRCASGAPSTPRRP